MNSRQKEVLEQSLKDEQAILDALVDNYTKALADIKKNIRELQANPLTQSKAYQLEFQKQLEQQISGILDNLQGKNFSSISGYLQTCYETGFIGAAYDWQGQGVPLVIPIDEGQVIKAVEKTGDDFRLSNKLGVSTKQLKEQVKTELQRGLATQLSYAEIARNISDYGQSNMNRSMLIARTEGHRVQSEARMDAMKAAKKKGADIVKQWDATLDGNTRQHHRELDGQIRELDEPFEVAGMKVDCPGDFGIAAEDCNCRCCVLQRARWAVEKVDPDTGEVTEGKYQKWNNETGGFIETTGYEDFKQKYLTRTAALNNSQNGGIIRNYQGKLGTSLGKDHYDKLHDLIDATSDSDAREVWQKFEDQVGVADIHHKGTAYCDRGGNIHIDIDACANGNSYDKPYQVVFHESGHAIDVTARRHIQGGNWGAAHFSAAYDNGKFPDTICKEVDDWVKSVGAKLKAELPSHLTDSQWLFDNGFIDASAKRYFDANGSWGWMNPPKYSKSVAYKAIEREIRQLPGMARADLSDILEGATNGRIQAGYGHGKGYWSARTINGVKDGLATEAFAEMMDSTFANADGLAAIQKYLPDSYSVFTEMLQYLKGVI
ncbi:MAG: hypothetical protein IJK58_06120 [Clostridia bacterium]|nr:hypothetical protein [Clostridia bacterium]